METENVNKKTTEKVEFDVKKLSAKHKFSKLLLSHAQFLSGHDGDDFVTETLTAMLEGYILSHTADNRVLRFECKKPRFLDWLLGRREIATFKLEVNDLLLNPPKLKNTKRVYMINNEKLN